MLAIDPDRFHRPRGGHAVPGAGIDVAVLIFSSFVERARQRMGAESAEPVVAEQLTQHLSEITSRLDRIQQTLDSGGSVGARPTLR